MTSATSNDRRSYLKTTLMAGGAAAAATATGAVALATVPGAFGAALGVPLLAVAAAAALVAGSGQVVLARHRRAEQGRPDLYLELNTPRREAALQAPRGHRAGALRRVAARAMLGHDFLVGDTVEVKSLEEIRATLDERGCLDGMPFMPEMARFCGSRGQVFRSIDKIYDYGRTRKMRRLRGCVLLSGLRCDGADHGECQARCYIVWKTEWLRRPGTAPAVARSAPAAGLPGVAPARVPSTDANGAPRERYLCQYTELHASSTPMGMWEIGKELRPLVAGNVTLATWLAGLATRLFNQAQALRGGSSFPAMPPRGPSADTTPPEPLSPGDVVVVRPAAEIARTLNANNKHRGLWFDIDQTKHCGRRHTVLLRVERIIDDAHGQMLTMKTPCILLDGVDYSGETLNFTAQHDLFFWREHWLQKQPR